MQSPENSRCKGRDRARDPSAFFPSLWWAAFAGQRGRTASPVRENVEGPAFSQPLGHRPEPFWPWGRTALSCTNPRFLCQFSCFLLAFVLVGKRYLVLVLSEIASLFQYAPAATSVLRAESQFSKRLNGRVITYNLLVITALLSFC